MNKRVAIQMQGTEPSKAELALREELDCGIVAASTEAKNEYDFLLCWQDGALTLLATASDAPGGLSIDFSDRALQKRALDGLKRQGIGKAVGLKKKPLPDILDATAGLGGDAYLLASAGCQVSLLERSNIVHALLKDALQRASLLTDSQTEAAARNLKLSHADFLDQSLDESSVDVVYLDPMFPDRDKSSLVKKEMRLFKPMVGGDLDAAELLKAALEKARYRVVVKRPRKAPEIEGVKPTLKLEGKSSRYDIYTLKSLEGLRGASSD